MYLQRENSLLLAIQNLNQLWSFINDKNCYILEPFASLKNVFCSHCCLIYRLNEEYVKAIAMLNDPETTDLFPIFALLELIVEMYVQYLVDVQKNWRLNSLADAITELTRAILRFENFDAVLRIRKLTTILKVWISLSYLLLICFIINRVIKLSLSLRDTTFKKPYKSRDSEILGQVSFGYFQSGFSNWIGF